MSPSKKHDTVEGYVMETLVSKGLKGRHAAAAAYTAQGMNTEEVGAVMGVSQVTANNYVKEAEMVLGYSRREFGYRLLVQLFKEAAA